MIIDFVQTHPWLTGFIIIVIGCFVADYFFETPWEGRDE